MKLCRIPLTNEVKRNRPWLLLVLWPLLCGAWLGAAHDPDACLPAASHHSDVESVSHHDEHAQDDYAHDDYAHAEHSYGEVSTSNRVLDVQSNAPQLESSHLEAHEECASCSLIAASASDEANSQNALTLARVFHRWTRLDFVSFPQRHTRGFSTRGPPSVFA